MKRLIGMILVLVVGCGTRESAMDHFSSEMAITLTAEQITEALEIRTGQWKNELTATTPHAAPVKGLELMVGRWKKKGHSIEAVGYATGEGKTEYAHLSVNFDNDRNIFVERLKGGASRTTIRHSRWYPNSRTFIVKIVAPSSPQNVRNELQIQVVDAQTIESQFKLFGNNKEVLSVSGTGKKTGAVDDIRFDELMMAFQKQRAESGFPVRDKNGEVTEISGDYRTDADLRPLKDLPEFERLELIGYEKITDTGLVYLKGLIKLRTLDLDGCEKITDAGLVHLKEMTNLETLGLSGCEKITDAGLVHLKGLTNLQFLFLMKTQITDAGLVHLKDLTNLEYLDLRETPITDSGVAELQKAVPNCEIIR